MMWARSFGPTHGCTGSETASLAAISHRPSFGHPHVGAKQRELIALALPPVAGRPDEVGDLRVVRRHHPPLARRHGLHRVEREAPGVAERTRRLSLVAGADRLRRVLED